MKYPISYIYILFLFALNMNFGNITYAQTPFMYHPYTFHNYTPKWQHVVYDSSIVGWRDATSNLPKFIYNGWDQYLPAFERLYYDQYIEQEYLYLLTLNYTNFFQGGMVEKINLNSGEVEWQQHFDKRDDDRRRFPYMIYSDRNHNIKIIGARQAVPDKDLKPYPLWHKGEIFSLVYDQSNGTLKKYIYGDEQDTSTHTISNFVNIAFSQSVKDHLFPYDTAFQFIEAQLTTNTTTGDLKLGFYSLVLTEEGYPVSSSNYKSFNLSSNQHYNQYFNTAKVGMDTFVCFIHAYKNEKSKMDSFDLHFVVFDQNLDSLQHINLNTLVAPAFSYKLSYIDNKYFIIRGDNFKIKDGFNYIYEQFYLFDFNGHLLEKVGIIHNNKKIIDSQISIATKLKYDSGMLIVSSDFLEDSSSYIDFYKSNGSGQIDNVKHLELVQKNQFLGPVNIKQLDNGDILFYNYHLDYNYAEKHPYHSSKAEVLSLFPAQDLQLTKTIDTPPNLNYITISIQPNPSVEKAIIQFSKQVVGTLNIIDMQGKLVEKYPIKNTDYFSLDIRSYIAGSYIVAFYPKNGIEIKKKLVIIH